MTIYTLLLVIVSLALLTLVVVALRGPAPRPCRVCGYPIPAGVWEDVCVRCDMGYRDVLTAARTGTGGAATGRTEVPEVFRRAWGEGEATWLSD